MSVSTRRETLLDQETTRFATRDWLMLAGVSLTWGASFLFIDVGLEHFAPALVAFGRVAFGALTLSALPGRAQAGAALGVAADRRHGRDLDGDPLHAASRSRSSGSTRRSPG